MTPRDKAAAGLCLFSCKGECCANGLHFAMKPPLHLTANRFPRFCVPPPCYKIPQPFGRPVHEVHFPSLLRISPPTHGSRRGGHFASVCPLTAARLTLWTRPVCGTIPPGFLSALCVSYALWPLAIPVPRFRRACNIRVTPDTQNAIQGHFLRAYSSARFKPMLSR